MFKPKLVIKETILVFFFRIIAPFVQTNEILFTKSRQVSRSTPLLFNYYVLVVATLHEL